MRVCSSPAEPYHRHIYDFEEGDTTINLKIMG